MPNELPDPATPPVTDETTHQHGLENGFQLVLEAEDHNDWKPVAQWLAHNPALAGDVAQFLDDQENARRALGPPPTAPDRAGMSFGGLEIREVLGRGGMGIVYRAYDPRLNKDVAVKMLRADGSPADLARFRFEAEMVASLDHPNIVPVYSFGEADGSPYLVMPLMTGGSLAQRLRNLGPDRCLPGKEAAELVQEIARGVHHAHQRGLIHRDLKPGNILLDRDGVPHVADFGLARRLDVSVTGSGGIAGTVAYMASEQAHGEKALTTAVDVYSLGVILFELLTGRTPFEGGDMMSVLRRVIEDAAPPVRQFRPDVERDLEAVCLKCLEKQPEHRYASAKDVADELDRYLRGEPVKARPPGFWDWVRQLARTQPERGVKYSWEVTAWFGALTLVTNVAIYAMVQYDAPAAGVWAANVLCSAGMGLVLWWYMMRRFRQLPVTERHSLIIGAGHVIGYVPLLAAFVPLSLAVPARAGLAIYPSMTLLSGLGLFTLGSTNWSRFFPVGIVVMALTPLMAHWPDESPLLFGGVITAIMWYWTLSKRRLGPR